MLVARTDHNAVCDRVEANGPGDESVIAIEGLSGANVITNLPQLANKSRTGTVIDKRNGMAEYSQVLGCLVHCAIIGAA
jgi:hypothetical protein